MAALFRFVQADMPSEGIIIVGSLASASHTQIGNFHLLNQTGHDLTTGRAHRRMYAAIDLLTDKLDRCVMKHKEKRKDHLHP